MSTTPPLQSSLDRPHGEGEPSEDYDSRLGALYDSARSCWSGLEVSFERFAQYLKSLDGLPSTEGARELYLALGCDAGNAVALKYFYSDFLCHARVVYRNLGLDTAQQDDLAQTLVERLVSTPVDGGEIKLLKYSGQGRLPGFMKVAATRLVHNLRRGVQRRDAREVATELREQAIADPELRLYKQKYREAFAAAFETAVGRLEPELRNLLRLNLVDRLTVEQLGAALGVHASTASRRLKAARDFIAKETSAELRNQLGFEPKVQSLVELVPSRLELSVGRLLRK